MAGIKPKKVFLYDENGKFIRDFESISDFTRTFNFEENIFSQESHLFNNKVDLYTHILPFKDGRIASTFRIGRKGVIKYKKFIKSPLVGKGKNIAMTVYRKTGKGKVIFFDLEGEKIAEFKSPFQAAILTGIDRGVFAKAIINKRTKLQGELGITFIVKSYEEH